MDIFAHGLWVGAAAKGLNKREGKRRVNVWAMTLWGVFPDLFAFTIPFVWLAIGVVSGNLEFGEFGRNQPPLAEPMGANTALVFQLSSMLYNFGHSLIIFFVVFFAVWLFLRRPVWELGGWFIHILQVYGQATNQLIRPRTPTRFSPHLFFGHFLTGSLTASCGPRRGFCFSTTHHSF